VRLENFPGFRFALSRLQVLFLVFVAVAAAKAWLMNDSAFPWPSMNAEDAQVVRVMAQ
jgi:hypothetical protein